MVKPAASKDALNSSAMLGKQPEGAEEPAGRIYQTQNVTYHLRAVDQLRGFSKSPGAESRWPFPFKYGRQSSKSRVRYGFAAGRDRSRCRTFMRGWWR